MSPITNPGAPGSNDTLFAAWSRTAAHAQLLADEAAASRVARELLDASDRARASLQDLRSTLGRVPLAADRKTRFPVVWVVPSTSLGRSFGPDVTAWMLGYEDRAFLRLVNLDPQSTERGLTVAEAGRPPMRAEVRVRPELPFALDELAADRVFELVPPASASSPHLAANDPTPWRVPDRVYDAERERATVREGWRDLVAAYADASTPNQGVRRARMAGALRRLLWVGDTGRPRRLRPWALLTLQSLAAEVLRSAPRRAGAFGLDALRGHPQCFPSLARRLPKG